MIKFFNAEDFAYSFEGRLTSTMARDLANAKLEREGRVVYGGKFCLGGEWSFVSHNNVPPKTNTHKALLINIEPIEQCKHPAQKVIGMQGPGLIAEFKCECGVKVKPKGFEVIE